MQLENPDNTAPTIFVTNDDGIESPGLTAAVQAVRGLGRIVVVAPTTQQTARGRSMVGNRADWLHQATLSRVQSVADDGDPEVYHLDASPALVVRHVVAVLFPDRPPDLLISGINYGENLGNNITISGTVGAAFQGATYGIPALAVSRQTDIEHHYKYSDLDWTDAIRVTRSYAKRVLACCGDDGSLPFDVLKIDVPQHCPPGTEERITRLSRRHYFVSRYRNPHRETAISGGKTTIEVEAELLHEEDDIRALAVDGVVSITPLTMDFTAGMAESRAFLGF